MRRRNFQEVALSLTEPGTVLHDDTRHRMHHPLSSTSAFYPTPVETEASAFTFSRNPVPERRPLHQDQTQQQQQLPPEGQQPQQEHLPPPHRAQLTRQLSRHSATSSSQATPSILRQHPKHPLSRSASVSILYDSETDSADYESAPVEAKPGPRQALPPSTSSVTRIVTSVKRKAKNVRRTVVAISRSALSSGRSSSESPSSAVQKPTQSRPQRSADMEDIGVERRIDAWQSALKAAVDQDMHGQMDDALEAYDRLNRNITKGAIYDYEQLSCDQKKLLGQVLTCLDMRTQQLRIKLEGSRAQICKPGLASTGPLSKDAITSAAETMALNELTKCLEVLDTIRRMGSKTKVPVVLVYRERKHRTQHRHEEKGQSNKVVFPKEKRDFLSLMGLPGSMFSEKGFDFTVRPNTASALRKLQEEEAQHNRDNQTRDTTDVGEIEPDEKNGGTAVQVEEEDTDSPKTAKKNLLTYLPFMKKTSVAPHPESEDAEGRDIEEAEDEEEEAADARSTLSCDTCSSAGSSDTEEELEDVTDTPVAGATYAHKETVLPPPFKEVGSTYVTLGLEKVGLKNTGRIVCPFIRVSVRDSQGNILSPESTQESAEWEIVNRNYLRAPSQIHLQCSMEDIPEDAAIFLELRHYRPQKNIISTLCYTFLDRHHLSNERFVCELYTSPVDYTRKNLKMYSEKAFFLHLEVMLRQTSCEVQTLDSPKSTASS
ncbi:uncharacterized protein [Macrobrachium rosenbergii]|uniref:uncharacterized protein n=1 Tax=Macrobrachium rosenbergii TaxID=79674 RepID=UPI0034D4A943